MRGLKVLIGSAALMMGIALAPAAQAQMKAMLNSMAQPQISKSCITEEELKRGFNLNHKMDAKCHQTTVNLSSSAMEIGETCAYGDGSATMHGKFEAVDRATKSSSARLRATASRTSTGMDSRSRSAAR